MEAEQDRLLVFRMGDVTRWTFERDGGQRDGC